MKPKGAKVRAPARWRAFRISSRQYEYLGALLTLASSVFLLRGGLSLGATEIAELSRTRLGYSLAVIESLAQQRADTQAGLALLLLGFLCQVRALIHQDTDGARSEVPGSRRRDLAWCASASILALAIACGISGALSRGTVQRSVQILKSSPDRGETTLESAAEREAREIREKEER